MAKKLLIGHNKHAGDETRDMADGHPRSCVGADVHEHSVSLDHLVKGG